MSTKETDLLARLEARAAAKQQPGGDLASRLQARAASKVAGMAGTVERSKPGYVQPGPTRAAAAAQESIERQAAGTPLPRPVPLGERFSSAANQFAKTYAADLPAGFLDNIAVLSKELDPFGEYEGKDTDELATAQLAELIRGWSDRTFQTNPALRGRFVEDVLPQAFGSMAGFMTGSAGAKLLGASGAAASATLGAGLAGGAAYREARAAGATDEDARDAALLNMPLGATEAVPVERALNAGVRAATTGVGRVLREGAISAGEEVLQETGQQIGGNLIARGIYDPTRGVMEGVPQAAGAALIVGGAAGAGAAATGEAIAQRRERAQPPAGATPAAKPATPPPPAEVVQAVAVEKATAGAPVVVAPRRAPGEPPKAPPAASVEPAAPALPVEPDELRGRAPVGQGVVPAGVDALRAREAELEGMLAEAQEDDPLITMQEESNGLLEELDAVRAQLGEVAGDSQQPAEGSIGHRWLQVATSGDDLRTTEAYGRAPADARPALEAELARVERFEAAAQQPGARPLDGDTRLLLSNLRHLLATIDSRTDAEQDTPAVGNAPSSPEIEENASRAMIDARNNADPGDISLALDLLDAAATRGDVERLVRQLEGSLFFSALTTTTYGRLREDLRANPTETLAALRRSLAGSEVENAPSSPPSPVEKPPRLIQPRKPTVRYNAEGRMVVISGSAKQPGRLQATKFHDAEGTRPYGDMQADAEEGFAEYLAEDGFTLTEKPRAREELDPAAQEKYDALYQRISDLTDARTHGDRWTKKDAARLRQAHADLAAIVSAPAAPKGEAPRLIEKKPATPQLPPPDYGEGTKYVLPSFVTAPYAGRKEEAIEGAGTLSQSDVDEMLSGTSRSVTDEDRAAAARASSARTWADPREQEHYETGYIAGLTGRRRDYRGGSAPTGKRAQAWYAGYDAAKATARPAPSEANVDALLGPSKPLSDAERAAAESREEEMRAEAVKRNEAEKGGTYGAGNKVFTADAAAAARERLKKKLGGELRVGIDPELMMDAITLGGYHAEAGVRAFGAWSAQMVEDVGEGIRPYLRSIYSALRTWPGFDASGMTADAQIDEEGRQAPTETVAPAARVGDTERDTTRSEGADADPESAADEPRAVGDAVRGEPTGEPARPARQDEGGRESRGARQGAREAGSGAVRGDARPAGEGVADPEGVRGESGAPSEAAPAGARAGDGGPARTPTVRNFRISERDSIGAGGKTTKVRQNLAAIRLLKTLEAEERAPTAEEQAVLVKYTGWGGLKEMFSTKKGDTRFAEERAELAELLSEEEMRAASKSVRNAHYTSPTVIRAMWDAAVRLGVGRETAPVVLEPSMGVGHFFGLAPDGIAGSARFFGIELDNITGRIARQLYPEALIRVQGFETVPMADGSVDLAISNVPFGNYPVADKAFPKAKQFLTKQIHDYFFARTLDKMRPGGVVAYITSDGTLDKGLTKVRNYLAEQADFLGAIRLPIDAFKANAGATVTTDIIFLRRRAAGAKPAHVAPWVETATLTDANGKAYQINEYYAAHPEMMLGEVEVIDNRYGAGEEAHLLSKGKFSDAALAEAVNRLPEGAYQPRTIPEHAGPEPFAEISAASDMAEGAYIEVDGNLFQKVGGQLIEPMLGTGKTADVVRRLVGVRDAVREVLRTQREDASLTEQEAARARLNASYDAFVKKYGPIRETTWYEKTTTDRETGAVTTNRYARELNLSPFLSDPDSALIAALEDWDEETRTATKTAVFTHRVIFREPEVRQVEDPVDALPVILAQTGRVDLDALAALTGKTVEEVKLALEGLIFEDPATGQWETSDAYLSGNVRQKLDAAKSLAAVDARFAPNITALERVQPEPIDTADIYASLGAPWIEPTDYERFVQDLVGGKVKVRFHAGKKEWDLEVVAPGNAVSVEQEWGTEKADAYRLITAAMNQQTPIVTKPNPGDPSGKSRMKDAEATAEAMGKQMEIRERFNEWIWEDGERATRLHDRYNVQFNNLRTRHFDGSHLKLPGAAAVVKGRPFGLRAWQKAAIWRILQSRATLLAHVVGAGKTYSMVGAAMEMRRLGLARKPMIAVPNHMLRQFSSEFLEMYPNAKLLIADEYNFDAKRRRRFTAKIATGDWDAVIMTHSAFELVGVSREAQAEFIREQLKELEEAIDEAKAEKGTDNKNYISELETALEKLEVKLNDVLSAEKKDNLLSFEETGVDALFVDEAHLFKNLFTRSKIKGMAQMGSERAMDLYLKTRYLHKTRGRIIFATGTPISNSMGEMFTMQRFLQPEMLKERGIESFDTWAAQFGVVKAEAELSVTGKFEIKERFSEFVNVPELIDMFHQVADVLLAGDGKEPRTIALPRPEMIGGKPEAFASPQPPGMAEFIEEVITRMDAIRKRAVSPEEDNALKVATHARHASLDMRLIREMAVKSDERKVAVAAREIAAIYREHADLKGTQLVFLDLSTPSAASKVNVMGGIDYFSAYHDLRDELLRNGLPADQIAFMQDAAGSDKKKKELLGKVKAGQVRVLVGSTETMGAGTNVQDRLVALHHLDVPWKPAELEQREGRILRQGNLLYDSQQIPGVRVLRYVTEGSYDGLMWQTVERKARFIGQVMKGDTSVRRMEDLDAVVLDAASMKAFATGNPLFAEKASVDAKVATLQRAKKSHRSRQAMNRLKLDAMPGQIGQAEAYLAKLEADAARVQDTSGDAFTVVLGRKKPATFTKRADAGERLEKLISEHHLEWVDSGKTTANEQKIGDFAGFELRLAKPRSTKLDGAPFEGEQVELILVGTTEHRSRLNLGASAQSAIATLEALPRGLERKVDYQREQIETRKAELAKLRELTGTPFPKEDELAAAVKRQEEIDRALNPPEEKKDEAPPPNPLDDDGIEYRHSIGLPALMEAIYGKPKRPTILAPSGFDEVEERWRKAKGIIEPSLGEKAREGFAETHAAFRRHFPHLNPGENARTALTVDTLRTYEASPAWAKALAYDHIRSIVEGLSYGQVDLLTRVLVTRDLQRNAEEGLYGGEQPTDGAPFVPPADAELPYGYTPATLAADLARFERQAAADEKVRDALARRTSLAKALTERLVKLELLKPDVLKDDRYYHRQVLKHINAQAGAPIGTGSRDVRMKKKGFQRQRSGTDEDANTLYQESEFEWMAQGLSLIARKEALDRVRQLNDVLPSLKRQAKVANEQAAVAKDEERQARELGMTRAAALANDVELEDPFKRFRMKIGRAQAELRALAAPKAGRDGFAPETVRAFGDLLDAWKSTPKGQQFDHADWWKFLAHLAAEDERPGSIQARTIFKAVREKEEWIRATLGKEYQTWEDLVPEGYSVWQPEKGNHFYLASTIEERVLDSILTGEKALVDSDVRKMLVVGGPKEEWVIPTDVAATLEEFNPPTQDHTLESKWTWLQASWKQWILLNPVRVLKYNLNNLSGDVDVALAYDPTILKHYRQAARDLWAYQIRGEGSPALKAELQEAMRLAVLDSGLSLAEIPDINRTGVFRALTEQDPTKRANLIQLYWENGTWGGVRGFTNWRENILRLAAYRHFQAQIAKGRGVYGASSRAEVDAIRDPKARAAKLARELVGDYGNVSHAGKWIRRHLIPFYSWMELNAPRYYRMMANVRHEGGNAGRVAGVGGLALARRSAVFALKVHALYLLAGVWNHLFFPDEEDELRENGREAHLILGRREDGSIRTLRVEGAFADALSWFDLQDYAKDVADVLNGSADLGDKAAEAVKAPLNRLVQSLEPFSKTLFEVTLGRSTYPSIFEEGKSFRIRTRPIRDRGEHAARTVSMDWLYRYITNKPRRRVDDPLLSAIESTLFYSTDPGEAAYWEVRTKAAQFLEAEGREAPSINPTRRQNALFYYKRAAQWGDEERAAYWLKKYYEMGGEPGGLRQSLTRSRPLASVPVSLRSKFKESLTAEERHALELAEEWHQHVMGTPGRDSPSLAGRPVAPRPVGGRIISRRPTSARPVAAR